MAYQIKKSEHLVYDAIVVGSGISGGWAAKELCEKGLKVLLLERGRHIEHISGYTTAMKEPWDFPHRGRLSLEEEAKFYYKGRSEMEVHHFVADHDFPYERIQPFKWTRGYQTGGKSLTWGRQSYRWNKKDFTANSEEGVGVDWPIRYEDLEPWYSYVERFAGISGTSEKLDVLPDSVFQPGMPFNCVEEDFKNTVESKFKNRKVTIGRVAHLTSPTPEQLSQGRGSCQYRNKCSRGCPYGAYFSSQAATLPAAEKTGNLTRINGKVVFQMLFDQNTQKVIGVKTLDQATGEEEDFHAKLIFLNASAINSAWIMLQSKSSKHPNGLGNVSDQLGRNIMDHHHTGIDAAVEGYLDRGTFGSRPNGIYIPRFVNWKEDKRDYLRGFGYQAGAFRMRGDSSYTEDTFGTELKKSLTLHGSWRFWMAGFGETLPNEKNRMFLSKENDSLGLPLVALDASWEENTLKMREDVIKEGIAMLEAFGMKDIQVRQKELSPMGAGIHEMGTARMGHHSKSSVLNKWNQVWGAENVFVTDGACMTSSSCVNPSLTYMAITARAANYAVEQLKKENYNQPQSIQCKPWLILHQPYNKKLWPLVKL